MMHLLFRMGKEVGRNRKMEKKKKNLIIFIILGYGTFFLVFT